MAPFRSDKQRAWMYANKPQMAKQWSKDTPKPAGKVGAAPTAPDPDHDEMAASPMKKPGAPRMGGGASKGGNSWGGLMSKLKKGSMPGAPGGY